MGNSLVQKETADLYFDGKIIKLNDFKTMEVYGLRKEIKITNTQDKGLKDELDSFLNGIIKREWPIPLWQQIQVCNAAFSIEELI